MAGVNQDFMIKLCNSKRIPTRWLEWWKGWAGNADFDFKVPGKSFSSISVRDYNNLKNGIRYLYVAASPLPEKNKQVVSTYPYMIINVFKLIITNCPMSYTRS